MEVLILAHRIPYPPDKGDKIRSHRWLTALAGRHVVHLGCFIDDAQDRPHLAQLGGSCASVHAAALPPWRVAARGAHALVAGEAITAAAYRDRGLARWVADRLAEGRIGCILAYSSGMAGYCGSSASGPGRILDFVDVDSEKWRLRSLHARGDRSWLYRREAKRLLAHDREAIGRFDIGCFVSSAEAERFRALAPESGERLRVLRNGVDAGYFAPERGYPDPYGGRGPVVALTGAMDYWPNEEAAIWFARAVLPRLRAERPALRLAIVGRAPSRRVRRLAESAGVEVTGPVADVRPYVAHAAAVVAPMQAAIGVPNKVLEGMAMERPVIATSQGVGGLDLRPGLDLLVADGPEAFAAAVREALVGGERIEALARQARRRVLADYDWPRVEWQMLDLVAECASRSARARPLPGAVG